ncbi:gamma-glutamylcyclotransferase family protein [Balneatrix alpica]|uniref:Gamma-glutamylcyclotransferase family protein n=1 Tax=Balneatrix alpica TaxID=75684 RepID=A0ABV5ZAD3_9GAMM|nr:gamma-glutamylcyclotransferase family protein [Balneatrix alpica]
MTVAHFWYFGYGSLVNGDTRPRDTLASPYRLQGWKRQWRHRIMLAQGGHCALTVAPCATTSITGVLVQSPLVHLSALDERELGYNRIELPCASSNLGEPAYIYQSQTDYFDWADERHPILQSYVDVVVCGYLNTFGKEAAIDFIRTTEGWHCPVLNDRAAPRYPRAIQFKPGQQAQVDQLLQEYAGYDPARPPQ